MAYLNKIYVFIVLGVLIMALGSDGDITMTPTNKAVLLGSARVNMSCTSSYGFQAIAWSYTPIGSSTSTTISFAGSNVVTGQQPFYAVEQSSGSEQSNLIILSATTSRAGTYLCNEGASQAAAQLIVINSDPVCSMTPNAPAELLFNQTVPMTCSITYSANSNVYVDMTWSKDDPATIVTSPNPHTNTSANLTTAISTITQTTGYSSTFPIYRCNTTFNITVPVMNPPTLSATNAPDYSKSTQLNSPIDVIYLRPANESSITGAKDGDRVYLGTILTCTVDGNPTPSYSWWDDTAQNTTNTSTIQIWHGGLYRCTASNKAANSPTSVSINVTTYITTAAPTTATSTTPTTTVISRSTSPGGSGEGDTTAPAKVSGGLSETQKIIIGVVVGVGGALLIAAVAIVIYCCLKKKNKADRYSSGSEGTLSKSPAPPPYDDNGHRGPQRSSNPDIVQGYQMDDYPKNFSPYSTAGEHQNKPYIEDEALNYAQIQLDNNPRSRQPLQVAPQETNYSEVRLA